MAEVSNGLRDRHQYESAHLEADSPRCPLCPGSDKSNYVAGAIYVSAFNAQEYRLRCCTNCGLRYWTPLQIIPEFYENEGFGAYADYHASARPFPPWAQPFFDRFPLRDGKLLDVGCGDGSFLARAAKSGFDISGIDLDERSIASAKSTFGLTGVSRATLEAFAESCRNKGIRFDVITFFEVLEHQDQPSLFLTQVLDLLQPDGYVAGSVPNADRFLAGIDRRFSAGDLPPHHFLWFSKKTLERFLDSKGLKSISVYPSGNIPFAELKVKASRLLYNLFGLNRGRPYERLLQALVVPAVMISAAILWTGYRRWPAHLYFQARALHRADRS